MAGPDRPRLIVAQRRAALWTPDRVQSRLSRIGWATDGDLPAELLPSATFRPITSSGPPPQPSGSPDIFWVAPTPEVLGLPDLDDPVSLLSKVPFDGAMRRLSLLATEVEFAREDLGRHKQLAFTFYPSRIAERVSGFIEASDRHLAFDRQQIATLQREVIHHAADDPVDNLNRDQLGRLSLALLAVAARGHGGAPDVIEDQEPDLDAWQRYLAQLGVYYARPWFGEGVARAWSWYADVAPGLTTTRTIARSTNGCARPMD